MVFARNAGAMTFLWLHALWLLLVLPGLTGVYFVLLHRRNPALRYPTLSQIGAAMTPASRLRRHLPALLLMMSLVASVIAVARPTTVLTLPSEQRTIVLAIDVSLSMAVEDVRPSRIAAAKAAATSFANSLPRDVKLGVIAFAGDADLVQTPTLDHGVAIAAIEDLQLRPGTALGSGVIGSLLTLFPDSGIGGNYDIFGMGRSPLPPEPSGGDALHEVARPYTAVPAGSYTAAAIILLTDGRSTTGPLPSTAAKLAAQRGVRVYTVGFGQPHTTHVEMEGQTVDVSFDADTLERIASATGAEYFHASTAEELNTVYRRLNGRIAMERQETEVTALLAALAALLLAAAALSAAWFGPLINRFTRAGAVAKHA